MGPLIFRLLRGPDVTYAGAMWPISIALTPRQKSRYLRDRLFSCGKNALICVEEDCSGAEGEMGICSHCSTLIALNRS